MCRLQIECSEAGRYQYRILRGVHRDQEVPVRGRLLHLPNEGQAHRVHAAPQHRLQTLLSDLTDAVQRLRGSSQISVLQFVSLHAVMGLLM